MTGVEHKARTLKDTLQKLCSAAASVTDKDTQAYAYVLEKTVRIAGATLRVAEAYTDEKDIQQDIQRTCMRLVTDASRTLISRDARGELLRSLATLAAIIETLRVARMLTEDNAQLLIVEAGGLADFVAAIHWREGRKWLDRSLLAYDVPSGPFEPEPLPQAETPFGPKKDMAYAREQARSREDDRNTKDSEHTETDDRKGQWRDTVLAVQKDRRATILGLLQRRDRVTVKDVAQVIRDCSEKTIQRELLALVAQGVLKKEGERRWSTYTLS